jgi:hypothetical protein
LKKVTDANEKEIVDIKISTLKKVKKLNLLEDILSKDSNSFGPSHNPIIIVPSNVMPGNLCLQNSEQFLS